MQNPKAGLASTQAGSIYRPPKVALSALSAQGLWRVDRAFSFTAACRHHVRLDTTHLDALLGSLENHSRGSRTSSVHEIEQQPTQGATGEADTPGKFASVSGPDARRARDMTLDELTEDTRARVRRRRRVEAEALRARLAASAKLSETIRLSRLAPGCKIGGIAGLPYANMLTLQMAGDPHNNWNPSFAATDIGTDTAAVAQSPPQVML
eukprot:SAG31_NODE_1541_length_7951_cov_263.159959_3_plen_209_part_00